MKNVDLFNQFVLRIFERLYEEFPVPTALNPREFVEQVELSPYPDCPVSTYYAPGLVWSTDSDDDTDETNDPFADLKVIWNVEATVVEVEAHLQRKLTDFEFHHLKKTGHRPVTPEEQGLLDEWEAERERIDQIRKTEFELQDESLFKERVFTSTLQFLVSEELIRFKDIPPPPRADQRINPPDMLIEKSAAKLSFMLTSKGFSHLNKTIKKGKLADDLTLYEAIKKALRDNTVQGVVGTLVQAAITPLVFN